MSDPATDEGATDPCTVMRCRSTGSVVDIVLDDPEVTEVETVVCPDHLEQLRSDEQPWRWADGSQRILMGEDLDSGGALVLSSWSLEEYVGYSEMVIECRTPTGKPHEPVRFVATRDDLEAFAKSFRKLFPDLD